MTFINPLKAFGLILLLWNCKSLMSNLIEFNHFISKNNPHIICLTETWLLITTNLKFSDYTIYRSDRFGPTPRGGGVAILVKNTINSKLCTSINPYKNGHLENIIVDIFIENSWCKVCTLYNSHKNISESEFSYYFDSLGINSLITGDFNSHHSLWSEKQSFSNFSGRSLADTVNSNLYFNLLTPPGTPTYFSPFLSNYKSTIDLVFGSGKFSSLDFIKCENPLGSSDHYPIFYCFKKFPNSSHKSSSPSWSFYNFPWKE